MYRVLAILFLPSVLFACSNGVRIDNVPMYGQPEVVRPAHAIKGDQEFINYVKKEIGDLNKASSYWYLQAEKYFEQNNLDYAMRRYNQSWLLNPNNFQPYWGFGRVMLRINEFDRSIINFKKAKELIKNDFQKVALLADYGTALSYAAMNTTDITEKEELFRLAQQNFEESTALDPKYGKSWRQWAFSLYQQDNFIESRKKLNAAQSLGESYPILEQWLEVK